MGFWVVAVNTKKFHGEVNIPRYLDGICDQK